MNLHYAENYAQFEITLFRELTIEDFLSKISTNQFERLKLLLKNIERNQHLLAKYQEERFNQLDQTTKDIRK